LPTLTTGSSRRSAQRERPSACHQHAGHRAQRKGDAQPRERREGVGRQDAVEEQAPEGRDDLVDTGKSRGGNGPNMANACQRTATVTNGAAAPASVTTARRNAAAALSLYTS